VALIFVKGGIDHLLHDLRAGLTADFNEQHRPVAYCSLENSFESWVLDADSMQKQEAFLLVPRFQVLEPFLLRVDYKDSFVSLLYNLQIVENVLVVVNAHLL